MEWIGRARELRRRLSLHYIAADLRIQKLLKPIRRREGFAPKMPRPQVLQRVHDGWCAEPVGLSRLVALADLSAGKLRLGEVRAGGSKMRLEGWDGEPELAIALWSIAIISDPPAYAEERSLICDLGLHALARRFERGDGREDRDVLRDLLPLVDAYKATVADGGEFAIPVRAGGTWIGRIATVKGRAVLSVRTFVA